MNAMFCVSTHSWLANVPCVDIWAREYLPCAHVRVGRHKLLTVDYTIGALQHWINAALVLYAEVHCCLSTPVNACKCTHTWGPLLCSMQFITPYVILQEARHVNAFSCHVYCIHGCCMRGWLAEHRLSVWQVQELQDLCLRHGNCLAERDVFAFCAHNSSELC